MQKGFLYGIRKLVWYCAIAVRKEIKRRWWYKMLSIISPLSFLFGLLSNLENPFFSWSKRTRAIILLSSLVLILLLVIEALYQFFRGRIAGLKYKHRHTIEKINSRHQSKIKEKVEGLRAEIDSLKSQQEEKPNLVYLYPQISVVHIDAQDIIQDGGDADKTIAALVVKFQNKADPPRKVSPAKSVIAHITYYEVNGEPYEYAIDKGAWITKDYNHIDFEVGDAQRLVIATKTAVGNLILGYQNNNDSSNSRWHHKLSVIPLKREQFIVHVELVVRGNTEAGKIFKFRLTLKPTFMLELLDNQESF